MKEFLSNNIVIGWVSPLIIGLILLAIPTIYSRVRNDKIENKNIQEGNRRYLDSLRSFIIQKVKISSSYIKDIRKSIINELNLKDNDLYTEIQIRNKIILDIAESKYINEIDKSELIYFTYECFKDIKEPTNRKEKEVEIPRYIRFISLIKNPYFLLLFSWIYILLIQIFDTSNSKPEDNILLVIPLFISILCLFVIIINFISNSIIKISRNNGYIKNKNYIMHYNLNEYSKDYNRIYDYLRKDNK